MYISNLLFMEFSSHSIRTNLTAIHISQAHTTSIQAILIPIQQLIQVMLSLLIKWEPNSLKQMQFKGQISQINSNNAFLTFKIPLIN